jgi:hypothetical protein
MGLPFNGDLVPTHSGFANLGVNVNENAQNAFDITSIRPFNHIHQISGVFHDPVHGQSGIVRFDQQQGCFEVSVDGGITFDCLLTTLDGSGIHDINGATGPLVTLDGANGAAILTDGNTLTVDVSGLSGIIDPSGGIGGINGQIGPYLEFKGNDGVDVNVTDNNCLVFSGAGLSGLVFTVSGQLQTNIDAGGGGSDGSGLNAINGALGPNIEIDGANGADVLTNGNIITVDVSSLSGIIPIPMSGLALSRGVGFTEQTSVTFSHGIGGDNLIVQVQDSDGDVVIPDTINVSNPNSVDVTFNRPRSGRIVAIGSSSGVSVIPAEERAGLKQGINPYSPDGSGIAIPVGRIHYVDNTNAHRVLKLSSEATTDQRGGYTANDWVYVYVHASGTNDNIDINNFDYSADEPAFDGEKLGWYDTLPGSARRCVGAIQAQNSNRWRASRSDAGIYQHSDGFTSIITNDVSYVSQDVELSLPTYSDTGLMYLNVDIIGTGSACLFAWRPAGFSTGTNGLTVARLAALANPGDQQSIVSHFHGIANPDTKKASLEASTSTATVIALRQYGYIIPNYIGNTPG